MAYHFDQGSEVFDLFHPKLVLGISDELPQGAGEEAIEQVMLMAE